MSFNPRSPLPGSEALPLVRIKAPATLFQSALPVAGERSLDKTGDEAVATYVSIRAPRCRGAKRGTEA